MEKERGAIWKFSAYGFLKNLRFFEPFLLLFFLSKGFDFFQIGLLISIREVFVYLLEIPTGAYADVYGRKRSMVLTFIFYIISFLIFYSSNSFLLFSLAMLFFALGETLRSGTHKSIIFAYLDRQGRSDEKVKVYGLTRSYSKIGSSINALLAGALVFFRGDYGIIFLASTVPYFLDLILMLTYPNDKPTPEKDKFLPSMVIQLKETFRSLKKLKDMTIGVVNLSLNSSFFKISKDYLQPILNLWALTLPIMYGYRGEKRTAVVIGIVYFFIFIVAATASRNASRIKNRMGESTQAMNKIYLITFISFILIGIMHFFNLYYPIIFLFFVLYFLRNARKPMMVGYIADIAEDKQRATILSVENQLRSIVALVVAPLLGLLADKFGVYSVFLFTGVLLLMSYSLLRLRPVKSEER